MTDLEKRQRLGDLLLVPAEKLASLPGDTCTRLFNALRTEGGLIREGLTYYGLLRVQNVGEKTALSLCRALGIPTELTVRATPMRPGAGYAPDDHPWSQLFERHVSAGRAMLAEEMANRAQSNEQFMRDIVAAAEAGGLASRTDKQRPMLAEDLVRVLRGEIMELVRDVSPALKYFDKRTYDNAYKAARAAHITMPDESHMLDDDPRVISYDEYQRREKRR